jgi:SAM-dependent methyltransferase
MTEPNRGEAVVAAQAHAHGQGHDYEKGSPHLRHPSLRSMIEQRLTDLVEDTIARTGSCHVVEVGAGHGTFTALLRAAGATVTVTEASAASAEHLRRSFFGDDRVTVIHDETGEGILGRTETWDLAVIISVLHHIPDYVSFLDRLQRRISEGGAIFSVQDPLYYPRRSRISHRAGRGTYLAWRLLQGNYAQGLATRVRRLRGVYDESQQSDLVEYHVVRQGVDEEAIRDLLSHEFDVELFRYWSTQAPLFQWMFRRTGLLTDFGFAARNHRQS